MFHRHGLINQYWSQQSMTSVNMYYESIRFVIFPLPLGVCAYPMQCQGYLFFLFIVRSNRRFNEWGTMAGATTTIKKVLEGLSLVVVVNGGQPCRALQKLELERTIIIIIAPTPMNKPCRATTDPSFLSFHTFQCIHIALLLNLVVVYYT